MSIPDTVEGLSPLTFSKTVLRRGQGLGSQHDEGIPGVGRRVEVTGVSVERDPGSRKVFMALPQVQDLCTMSQPSARIHFSTPRRSH